MTVPSTEPPYPQPPDDHPVGYDVEYPDRPLNRLTTGLRLFTVIPILIVLGTVSGGTYGSDARRDLNRWLPLVKWLLAIPHYIVLLFLWLAALVVIVLAWFAILFTGRDPRGMFDFVVGVGRWTVRVIAYAFALVTDRYPPFRLAP